MKEFFTKKFEFSSTRLDSARESILCNSVMLYSEEKGYGFVNKTSTRPYRNLDTERLQCKKEGIFIEGTDDTISYINENNYNYGGLVFRIDTKHPGAYEVKVTLAVGSKEASVAVSGMNAKRLLDNIPWDSARQITKTNYAFWEGQTWCYHFVTGRNYIEIEVEPNLPTLSKPERVHTEIGIQSIEIRELDRVSNMGKSLKTTIYTLGDSTVKSYIYEEAIMSGWGQIFDDLFDLTKVNVVNYSMGGRSLFNMYHEGRFNEILMVAKPGDYLLLQSGHNDESEGEEKGPFARFGRGNTEESYRWWLKEEYVPAMQARGIIPIFVTPMTRIDKSEISDEISFAGFKNSSSPGIDFPGIMKGIGEELNIPVLNLYEESMKYLKSIGGVAAKAMFLSVEAGETPGKTNSGSFANGNPSGDWDGTHFKEALAKQWAAIVATELYRKRIPVSDFLKQNVKEAIKTGDWFSVYKEMSKDVLTGRNAYYREQIECMVKYSIMKQDEQGYFHPLMPMDKKEFIKALGIIWNLSKDEELFLSSDSLKMKEDIRENISSYLTREEMASLVYDSYVYGFKSKETGILEKPVYMTNYNGVNLPPEDPNYDSNLVGESAQYYPLVGFGVIEDKDEISPEYYEKFKTVYELGLMRSEEGIERGKMMNGTLLKPKEIVTREKAAKELYFLRILKKDIMNENDK